MTLQWIIVGAAVAAAVFYIARLLVRTYKNRGCAGCAAMPRSEKALKKLAKKEK